MTSLYEQLEELRKKVDDKQRAYASMGNSSSLDEADRAAGELFNARLAQEEALVNNLDQILLALRVKEAAQNALYLARTGLAPTAMGFSTNEQWLDHKINKIAGELAAALANTGKE